MVVNATCNSFDAIGRQILEKARMMDPKYKGNYEAFFLSQCASNEEPDNPLVTQKDFEFMLAEAKIDNYSISNAK